MNDPRYPGAEADNGVTKAVWQLLLAALFKLFITVFTFGIKVHTCVDLFQDTKALLEYSCPHTLTFLRGSFWLSVKHLLAQYIISCVKSKTIGKFVIYVLC